MRFVFPEAGGMAGMAVTPPSVLTMLTQTLSSPYLLVMEEDVSMRTMSPSKACVGFFQSSVSLPLKARMRLTCMARGMAVQGRFVGCLFTRQALTGNPKGKLCPLPRDQTAP